MQSCQHSSKRVSYYYDTEIDSFYYGTGHPMKPHRISLAQNLISSYHLYQKLIVHRPHKASHEEICQFHSDEYITFIQRVRPDTVKKFPSEMRKYNVGGDCPIFEGLYEFSQLSTGGSMSGAIQLNQRIVDVAINWAGGLHHAKKSEASGFCYVNDIVLAILELLKYHQRVVYIDIDVHHGDGVEEAFLTTDRVMTVSFHKYNKDFFPGTGDLKDTGAGRGRYYSVNVPLHSGIDDESYERLFASVMNGVMESYRPNAIVLQCGADSLTGDRLGVFNLTLKGHGKCVEFMMKYNLPLLLLGGGGYTIRNVARCWAYETGIALGIEIPNKIPFNCDFKYYQPDFELHLHKNEEMKNENSPKYLESVRIGIMENLRYLPFAPSVEMQEIPKDAINMEENDQDSDNPEERISILASDKRILNPMEFSDSEDEGEGRRNQHNFGPEKKRRRQGRSVPRAPPKGKKEEVKKDPVKKTAVTTNGKSNGKNAPSSPQPGPSKPYWQRPIRCKPVRMEVDTDSSD